MAGEAGVARVAGPRPLVFNRTTGALHTAPGTNFASDTCINASPTLDDGEALALWAKPQPSGAVAVRLAGGLIAHT